MRAMVKPKGDSKMKTPQRAQAARKRQNSANRHVMRDALMASLRREAKKGKRTTRLQAAPSGDRFG